MSDRRQVLELFEDGQSDWKQRAAEGIEKYRKGDAKLTVVDGNGTAVPNAKIKIRQKSHEFRFGANLFMLDELETEEKNRQYKEAFAELFNMATLPFYWDALEPERGKPRYDGDSVKIYRRPPIDLCMEFCEKHGIEPREHALAYDRFFPTWLYDANDDEVKLALEKRYREISERYAHKIRTIEVTNEMSWSRGKNRTGFYENPEFITWCFALAEKYFPNNQLVINEGTGLAWGDNCRASDKYYAYTEASMLKGAKIDAIGMQYHLFNRREDEYIKTRTTLNPDSLYRHMDLYSNLGKPLQVTEVTVPAYSWEAEDEEIQAEIVEKLYTIWFSHPNMEQIIYWNVADGYAYVPDSAKIYSSQGDMTVGENYYHGGLLRFDMSRKPAYDKIKELTQKVWHTETEVVTDQNGLADFRGFFGDYEVEIVTDGKKTEKQISLLKNKDDSFTLTV